MNRLALSALGLPLDAWQDWVLFVLVVVPVLALGVVIPLGLVGTLIAMVRFRRR